jgi:phosphoribosylamine-glycine ligase
VVQEPALREDPVNIGIYSIYAEGVGMIQRLREEGHDVALYVSDEPSRCTWDGLVWKVDDYTNLTQADVILFDQNGKGNIADQWRERGLKVWCGGAIADRLEKDRLFGMKTFSDSGVPIPDTWEVSGLGDVKKVCSSEFSRGEKAVVKLDGSDLCSMSYVAASTKDLIDQVDHWEMDGQIKTPWTGIVQRFVPGIEVSVEGWWNGESWSNHNLTIEEKKAWPGNLGPAVGCSYNTVCKIDPGSKLFKMMVEPISGILGNYTGQIDVNTIVGEDGPVALEFTPRPGYDATPTLAWGDEGGYGDRVLEALGMENPGKQYREPRPGPFWAGVRVSVPPYPFESKKKKLAEEANATSCGVPVVVPDMSSFYLYDAMMLDDRLVCAGTIGIIGVAMGGGSSPKAAGKAAYKVAEKLQVPNKAYRALDGWERAEKEIPELIEGGWIKM